MMPCLARDIPAWQQIECATGVYLQRDISEKGSTLIQLRADVPVQPCFGSPSSELGAAWQVGALSWDQFGSV